MWHQINGWDHLKLMGPRYPVLHLVMIIKRTKPRWANEQCGQPSNQKTGWLWLEPDRKPFIQVGPSGSPTYLNFFFFLPHWKIFSHAMRFSTMGTRGFPGQKPSLSSTFLVKRKNSAFSNLSDFIFHRNFALVIHARTKLNKLLALYCSMKRVVNE